MICSWNLRVTESLKIRDSAMLRLLALAAHFSPLNPGPFDPAVVELLNSYFKPALPETAIPEPTADCGAPTAETALKAA